jgi:hypothetical protein
MAAAAVLLLLQRVSCVPALMRHTLMNGDDTSCANRRAISVLPQPVGPTIKMFLGVICRKEPTTTLHQHDWGITQ